jgi:hypothetical protein
MPGLDRASTSQPHSSKQDVDGRVKPGPDDEPSGQRSRPTIDDFDQQTLGMPDMLYTAVFEALGAVALWTMVTDIRAGSTTNRGWTIEAKENPGGFYFLMFAKGAMGCFAGAILLHSLGLIGDPVIWIHQTFPFLKVR